MRRTTLLIFVLLGMSLMFAGLVLAEEEKPIEVFMDGHKIDFTVDPIIEHGVTLVQFRPIFEGLGLSVQWNSEDKSITGTDESGLSIKLTIGSNIAQVDGIEKVLQVPPKVINDVTVIPLRLVTEATGNEIAWDGKTRTINISIIEHEIKDYLIASYIPDGWDSDLVINKTFGSKSDDLNLFDQINIYVNFAIRNYGTTDINDTIPFSIIVDETVYQSGTFNGLKANYYAGWENINLGKLPKGKHFVKVLIDYPISYNSQFNQYVLSKMINVRDSLIEINEEKSIFNYIKIILERIGVVEFNGEMYIRADIAVHNIGTEKIPYYFPDAVILGNRNNQYDYSYVSRYDYKDVFESGDIYPDVIKKGSLFFEIDENDDLDLKELIISTGLTSYTQQIRKIGIGDSLLYDYEYVFKFDLSNINLK